MAFQPTLHYLYEDELFPELEFSFKQSEVGSVVAAPHEDHEHDSSMEMPKLPESDCEDNGHQVMHHDGKNNNCRGRHRHRSERSSSSSNEGFGAISHQMGRRLSPLNLKGRVGSEHDNDKDGDGGDAFEQHSEGIVNACHHSEVLN